MNTKTFNQSPCVNKMDKGERIYICSPLRSNTSQGLEVNMQAARKYMQYATDKFQKRAMALHAYLPYVFNDDIPFERDLALKLGLDVLTVSDELFVCGNKISEGMKGEIEHAALHDKQITVFNKEIYNDVLMIVAGSGSQRFSIKLNTDNPLLGMPTESVVKEIAMA